MRKERGEPDSAGNAVQLGQRETVGANQKIRTKHGRKRSRKRAGTLMCNEARRLAAVEQFRNPRSAKLAVAKDFSVFCGREIKFFERAIKRERGIADRGQFVAKLRRERPRLGREPPRFPGEKRLRGERISDFRKIHFAKDSLFPSKFNFSLPSVPAESFIFRR